MQRLYQESRRLAESTVKIRHPWSASHSHLWALIHSARAGLMEKGPLCGLAWVDANFDTVVETRMAPPPMRIT